MNSINEIILLLFLTVAPFPCQSASSHDTNNYCNLGEAQVKIDCSEIYQEISSFQRSLQVEDIEAFGQLVVTENTAACADEAIVMEFKLKEKLSGTTIPFDSAVIVVPTERIKLHNLGEPTRVTAAQPYAAFLSSEGGEKVNCFLPEDSLILISANAGPQDSVVVSFGNVPTGELAEIFLQFRLNNSTAVERILHIQGPLSEVSEQYEDFGTAPPEAYVQDKDGYYETDYIEDEFNQDRPARSATLPSNLTALRRGHTRYSPRNQGESRKLSRLFNPHVTDNPANTDLIQFRRGHSRGHVVGNGTAPAVRSFASSADTSVAHDKNKETIEHKRGHTRWQPSAHSGQRSFQGIKHEEDIPQNASHVSVRRGHARYTKGGGQTRHLHEIPSDKPKLTNDTSITHHRRGHPIYRKLPDHHGRSMSVNLNDLPEGEEPPLRTVDLRRGHKAVKFKPTLGGRSIHLHRPEETDVAYNESLLQLKRGPKYRTKQDKLEQEDIFPTEAPQIGDRSLRDDSRPLARSLTNSRSTKNNDNNFTLDDRSLPEPTSGLTKHHLTRLAADYIPKIRLIYTGCGNDYSCFTIPKDCHTTERCYIAVSYRLNSAGRIHVVVLATNKHYVAIGFSKDPYMGDEEVVTCKRIPGTDRVAIWKSFNVGGNDRLNVVAAQNQSDIEPLSGAVYRGVITCDFTMPAEMISDHGVRTDFKNGKFYLLVATGLSNREPKGPGTVTHHGFTAVSETPLNLISKSPTVVTAATNALISAHIGLAVITYSLFMPVAILMARYGQQAYPHKSIKGLPLWIVIHLTFQASSTVCNVLSAILAFVGRSGATFTGLSSSYHLIVGLVIPILSSINGGLGIVIHQKKRKEGAVVPWLLKVVHYIVGHSVFALGAIELIRGAYLPKAGTACAFAVLAGYWVVFYALAHFLLMFNTDYLRRLQNSKEPPPRAFLGPAIHLDVNADSSVYDIRRATIVFMLLASIFFTGMLYTTFGISTRGCGPSEVGYIN